MNELEFSKLNPYLNIDFLEASTPDALLALIKGYPGQMKILAIYAVGSHHVAWVQIGFQKINKKGK